MVGEVEDVLAPRKSWFYVDGGVLIDPVKEGVQPA
jgi:hypothetical protein